MLGPGIIYAEGGGVLLTPWACEWGATLVLCSAPPVNPFSLRWCRPSQGAGAHNLELSKDDLKGWTDYISRGVSIAEMLWGAGRSGWCNLFPPVILSKVLSRGLRCIGRIVPSGPSDMPVQLRQIAWY